mmetsp:Transcript_74513/g.147586  ORF Transcript_74513/g.147586 Transcript_74513/m.147586 type:complete len:202 (-) Transcript_74513:11-616(-)
MNMLMFSPGTDGVKEPGGTKDGISPFVCWLTHLFKMPASKLCSALVFGKLLCKIARYSGEKIHAASTSDPSRLAVCSSVLGPRAYVKAWSARKISVMWLCMASGLQVPDGFDVPEPASHAGVQPKKLSNDRSSSLSAFSPGSSKPNVRAKFRGEKTRFCEGSARSCSNRSNSCNPGLPFTSASRRGSWEDSIRILCLPAVP